MEILQRIPWFKDRPGIQTLAILGTGVVAFTAGVMICVLFDPQEDHIQPAYGIGTILGMAGMLLPALSARPLRHIGVWVVPYLIAAYAGGLIAVLALTNAALFIIRLA